MSDVELICEKSFSNADEEILNRFIEFQQALIDKDEDKLNEIIDESYQLVHMSGKTQSKSEFIGEVMDGTLNYYKSEIGEPTILWGDNNAASLIADVTLTAKVYGARGKWTLNTVATFIKIDGVWYFGKWDN
ncbi:MAG: nuclear transport factor 2 family protein [Methanobrevibacter sp.]|uniref:nuclear transport factor 2 family protein n=1 Tax=uncultured Methanobrevibacter sp. TaxID=253161 RepID=UPI0025F56DF7|nr:nuclear transport factor 2 family protein [uncultured Methanobrevibacter sp.]MEE1129780.1 nuclear transport factor 2 family protein [Methanobrevibacter sp.]